MSRIVIPGKFTLPRTKKRVFVIMVAMTLFLSYLLYNIFNLQVLMYDYYRDKVYDQITTSSILKAKRGNIYDSNMNLLATGETVWRIFVSPRDILSAGKNSGNDCFSAVASVLSEALSLDYESTLKKISNTSQLDVTLKKDADEDEYLKVLQLSREKGLEELISTEASQTRYYPCGTLAAHVLGFTGSDNQGLYGLEYYYDDILTGVDGFYLYAKDANGNKMPSEYATYTAAIDGYSLITTLDTYVQTQLESQLQTIVDTFDVKNRATGIVMDVKTGAILAMATSSPFDCNSPYVLDSLSEEKLLASGYDKGSDEYKALKKELLEIMWSNKAVSEIYEPGSTFKIITVSSALNAGVTKADDKYNCPGYHVVGGWHISCHKRTGHGSGITLAYGLQQSCNPTMMQVAAKMGAACFYDYFESFGYLEKTGIDLPSEGSSIFHKESALGETELATASFGQRFKVSIISQLCAVAAVANGGKLVVPYVVEKVIDKDGNVITEHSTQVKRQVISEETADLVSQILEEGVSGNGGAKNAYVDGYKIAAKTGTSEKFDILDANGNSYLRIGSTVAYNISDDGGIATIIVVDEPTTAKYGSVVAAPYVSALFSKILPYLGYEPTEEKINPESVIENYIGLSVNTAVNKLKSAGIKYEIVGDGDVVMAQTPTAGDTLRNDVGKVILYTSPDLEEEITVPNLLGDNASVANIKAINSGLNIKIEGAVNMDLGSGATVSAQSIPAGSTVKRGTVITITLIYLDTQD